MRIMVHLHMLSVFIAALPIYQCSHVLGPRQSYGAVRHYLQWPMHLSRYSDILGELWFLVNKKGGEGGGSVLASRSAGEMLV